MADSLVTNSAVAVANWLIEQNHYDRSELSPSKLQKLLYYAQGWFLATFDYPLFEDPVEAWRSGPCVNSVFKALNRQKLEEVTGLIHGYLVENGVYRISIPKILFRSPKEEEFMISFWKKFSKIEPIIMINSTLNDDTPWRQVYNHLISGDTTNKIIPLDLLKYYFKNILQNAEK
ncbi:MAG: DUF4065 domain-containing protein [Deltaproteobacteria bacterium]|jgi:uncharacterized phage-associated protein|nr:DUF4065 domain-containing protein [Deltaproteobacteria bacterium]